MRPSDNELYRLFDRSPVGMFRSARDGTILYANTALARMLGYSVEELLSVDSRKLYADPHERERLITTFLPAGGCDGERALWLARDGRILTVLIYALVVETDAGTCFDCSVMDVTELDTARAGFERTAQTLEVVIRQMPAIYWIVDRDLRIQHSGGAIPDVLGYAPNTFIGKTLQDVQRVESVRVSPIDYHQRALAGETITYSSEYRDKQFSITVAPYRAHDGAIVGAIGTALDVTAARQFERRLVDAQRAESLGILAGGLAHDFNNLLVAVIGNADLAIRDVPAGAPGRAAIDNIRAAGLRAAELTDQLLAYAGRGGAGTTHVQLATVLDELLRITRASSPAMIAETVDVAADFHVRADPSQLRQVLLNLVTNARDVLSASRDLCPASSTAEGQCGSIARGGTLAIRARHVRHDGAPDPDDVLTAPAGDYIAIEVSDDGPGMDAETRSRVFEPFFTTKRTGHGLGLAAVLGIVRAHGGGLRLTSSPGAGATFTVLWPEAERAETAAAQPRAAARTVLVIDDEALVRDVVARMVEDLGYAALTAADGIDGLAMVETEPVDAVLVDMTMPRMNGADVVAQLRARHPEVQVILCSGYDRDGRGPVRADAYLPKPFRIDALERTLAKLLP